MSRKLIIAMAVLSFAFAGMTFAAVENIKVSGDINAEAVTRDLGFGSGGENADQYLFSQIRVKLDADLTEGVSAVICLLNERIWGGANDTLADTSTQGDGDTEVVLDLAYVELNEFLYDSLTLVVGRQNLRYGNALIIGDPDTNRYADAKVPVSLRDLTLRKSFDAVKGVLDLAPWTIDLVFAKVEENDLNLNDDVTIVGANAAYDWSSYNGVTEVYAYSVNNAPRSTTVSEADSKDKVYVLGGRAQADLNDNLTLGLEGAYQFGDYRGDANAAPHRHLNAFAVQAIAEYRLLDAKNTKLGLNYTYLSGDNGNETESGFNGWDPLLEDQSPGEIINILFDNTNMQYWQLSASTMPQEDLTVGVDYIYARLAQDQSGTSLAVTNSAAENSGALTVNAGDKEIGHEIDLFGVYDYTEDVQLKLTGGWLIPGNLFADANDNVGYSIRGGINVSF